MPKAPQGRGQISRVDVVKRRGPTVQTISYSQMGVQSQAGYKFPKTSQQIKASVAASQAPMQQIARAAAFARQVQQRMIESLAQAKGQGQLTQQQKTQQGKRQRVARSQIPVDLTDQIVRIYYLTQGKQQRKDRK